MTDAPERIWAVTDPDDVSADILGEVYAQQVPDGMVGKPSEYLRSDVCAKYVKVKPLVWSDYSSQGWRRGLVVGYGAYGGRETEIKRNPNGWSYGGKHWDYKEHGSCLNAALEAAKAAAQADYERRIREALE